MKSSEPTTSEGRALLERVHWGGLPTSTWRDAILAIEAAAAEADRARIRALRAAARALVNAADTYVQDYEDRHPDGEPLGDYVPLSHWQHIDRLRAVLAAIDDEAKTPQWRDDSGHWIGGNVGMPEPAIDDETLHERQVRLNYERPGRAAIDDEAKGTGCKYDHRTPERCWVHGSRWPRGSPSCDAAIDDEAKR